MARPLTTSRDRADVARGARYTLGAALVVVGLFLVWVLRTVLVPLLLGLLLAAGFDPLISRLERRGVRRGFAVLAFLTLLVLFLVSFLALALAPAATQLANLVQSLPELVEELTARFPQVERLVQQFDLANVGTTILERVPDVLGVGLGILSGISGVAFGMFTTLAFTAYFMLALPRIRRTAETALGDPTRVQVFSDALAKVGGYVTGQTLISITAGVTSFVFLVLLDVPYAVLLAITVGLLDLVPQVGAALGATVSVVVSLATTSVTTTVAVLVFFVVYQQLENYVIAPRVFARTVNLSPLTAFTSALVGATLGGFIGAIFALPVAAMVKTVLVHVYHGRMPVMDAGEPGTSSAG